MDRSSAVKVGVVILPEHRWAVAAEQWRCSEALGFDHAWTYDHLSWRDLRDGPWFGAVPTLAAAALVTTSIRLGVLVASPNYRHPVPFAKEIMSLDDLAGGRLTLGLGAGSVGYDASILGTPPWSRRERTERFVEFVDQLDVLLREPAVSITGAYYSATEARNHPGCVQQPRVPFAVAAAGPRGMRVAAAHGTSWVTYGDLSGAEHVDPVAGSRIVADQVTLLEEACHELGRDPDSIERIVLTGPQLDPCVDSVEAFRDMLGRYEEAGATDVVVHWPRESEPYRADRDDFVRAVSCR
jgi:alkanesulfonate monooxygenase SsuD/methylene tetrahydromethanopterin reductase-like flavin-dependent oxidoreductase (luciferase family)